MKDDGNDVFLINYLTAELVKLVDEFISDYISDGIISMDWYDILDLINFCDENNLEGLYCSNQEYCTKNFVFSKPVGFEYSDGEKSQVANVQGALLIVSEDSVRITNLPEDYQVLNPDEQIVGIEEI